jgi:RNA polymerase sigma-70 factor (ECF subfamily)
MEKLSFEEIYATYEKPVYNYVFRMVKDAQLTSDLTQDIFIKIYQNLEGYRGEANLSTWIYKIATNAYLDYFRTSAHKKEKVTEQLEDDSDTQKKMEEVKRVLSIDDKMVKLEMNACIREFLDKLPDESRAVIVLHDLQGVKNKEIADILSCSLETVKIRLHRARNKFRNVLASNCNFYRDPDDVFSCDRKEKKQDEV